MEKKDKQQPKKPAEKTEEVKTSQRDKVLRIIKNPTGFSNLANIPGDNVQVSRELEEKLIAGGYAKWVDKE